MDLTIDMIALIDYGAGNLTSVVKGFRAVGADVRIVDSLEGLAARERDRRAGRRPLRRDRVADRRLARRRIKRAI